MITAEAFHKDDENDTYGKKQYPTTIDGGSDNVND